MFLKTYFTVETAIKLLTTFKRVFTIYDLELLYCRLFLKTLKDLINKSEFLKNRSCKSSTLNLVFTSDGLVSWNEALNNDLLA